jgi:hypothetical protein
LWTWYAKKNHPSLGLVTRCIYTSRFVIFSWGKESCHWPTEMAYCLVSYCVMGYVLDTWLFGMPCLSDKVYLILLVFMWADRHNRNVVIGNKKKWCTSCKKLVYVRHKNCVLYIKVVSTRTK